jgi:hypothetical protein
VCDPRTPATAPATARHTPPQMASATQLIDKCEPHGHLPDEPQWCRMAAVKPRGNYHRSDAAMASAIRSYGTWPGVTLADRSDAARARGCGLSRCNAGTHAQTLAACVYATVKVLAHPGLPQLLWRVLPQIPSADHSIVRCEPPDPIPVVPQVCATTATLHTRWPAQTGYS